MVMVVVAPGEAFVLVWLRRITAPLDHGLPGLLDRDSLRDCQPAIACVWVWGTSGEIAGRCALRGL